MNNKSKEIVDKWEFSSILNNIFEELLQSMFEIIDGSIDKHQQTKERR